MSDNTPHMNRLLISITVFLCVICGLLFTQSSAGPSGNDHTSVIAGSTDDITEIISDTDKNNNTDSPDVSITSTPTSTPTPVPTEVPEIQKVSKEAKNGVWTPDGSNWKFLVDGNPYTGWLTDTDGHRYYFDKKGIMQRGWITVSKKQYYLDEDGILQTGTFTADGKEYTSNADGSVKK